MQGDLVFERDIWLVPLVGYTHWSLALIVNPHEMFSGRCECIHLDSIYGYHKADELLQPLLVWAKHRFAFEVICSGQICHVCGCLHLYFDKQYMFKFRATLLLLDEAT